MFSYHGQARVQVVEIGRPSLGLLEPCVFGDDGASLRQFGPLMTMLLGLRSCVDAALNRCSLGALAALRFAP